VSHDERYRPEQGTSDQGEPETGPSDPLVVFSLGAVSIAIPAEMVDAIIVGTDPTPLPLAPRHIPGVVSLRGRVIPLLDLGTFLGLPARPAPASAPAPASKPVEEPTDLFRRIVVTFAAGMCVGILCDQVHRIAEIPRASQREPLAVQGQRLGEFALAETELGGRLVVLLDLARVLEAARVPL
jgi:purine-binding chemotaxis protein CheW